MSAPPGAPPPQTFPYDYLFKVLIIGDASVGKVSYCQFSVLIIRTVSMEVRTNERTLVPNGGPPILDDTIK